MEAAGFMPNFDQRDSAEAPHGPHSNLDAPASPRNLKESSEIRHLIANLLHVTLLDTAETYRRVQWVKARVSHFQNVLARPDDRTPKPS